MYDVSMWHKMLLARNSKIARDLLMEHLRGKHYVDSEYKLKLQYRTH
jgi:hypothetical protein